MINNVNFDHSADIEAAILHLNEEVVPRLLRRYQEDFFLNGAISMNLSNSNFIIIDRSVEIKRNELWYGGKCSTGSQKEIWLLCGTIAEGYPIICVAEVSPFERGLLVVKYRSQRFKSASAVLIDEKLKRFLDWRLSVDLDWAFVLSPRLVFGHLNFAHQAWNEFPPLLELLKKNNSTNSKKIDVIYENPCFGIFEEIFSDYPCMNKCEGGWLDPKDGGKRLDYRVAGNLFTNAAKNMVRRHAQLLRRSPWNMRSGREEPPLRIWLNYRMRTRTATNQSEFLTSLIEVLSGLSRNVEIILFGFAFPYSDKKLPPSFYRRWQECQDYEAELKAQLSYDAKKKIIDLGKVDVLGAIRAALDIDYYVSGPGTAQHIPGWFADKPGHLIAPRNAERISEWYAHLNESGTKCNILDQSLYQLEGNSSVDDRNALYRILNIDAAVIEIVSRIKSLYSDRVDC